MKENKREREEKNVEMFTMIQMHYIFHRSLHETAGINNSNRPQTLLQPEGSKY
jgi:hypothetical protein